MEGRGFADDDDGVVGEGAPSPVKDTLGAPSVPSEPSEMFEEVSEVSELYTGEESSGEFDGQEDNVQHSQDDF